MAGKFIHELNEKTTLNDTDLLLIDEPSGDTKIIEYSTFKKYIQKRVDAELNTIKLNQHTRYFKYEGMFETNTWANLDFDFDVLGEVNGINDIEFYDGEGNYVIHITHTITYPNVTIDELDMTYILFDVELYYIKEMYVGYSLLNNTIIAAEQDNFPILSPYSLSESGSNGYLSNSEQNINGTPIDIHQKVLGFTDSNSAGNYPHLAFYTYMYIPDTMSNSLIIETAGADVNAPSPTDMFTIKIYGTIKRI